MIDETSHAPLPEASYIEAARAGRDVYRIVPHESLILVRVGRAGRMQRFGHEHAVASEDLQGFVEIGGDLNAARTDLAFPLRNLVVDKPIYRERLQLDTEPSDDDIAGTYTNMLNILEPALYPWAKINAVIVSGPIGQPQLNVSVVLHGTAFELLLPVHLETLGDRLIASGSAVIRHTDFGLDPFSAAGGLLRVADELAVEFRLVGNRIVLK